MIIEYKIEVTGFVAHGIKKGYLITFNVGDGYSFNITDKYGKGVSHYDWGWHQRERFSNSDIENNEDVKVIHKNIGISDSCEPYMYNTNDDLNKFKEGDNIELKFLKKCRKKKYAGKTIVFQVMNTMKHNWRRPTKKLALVPVDKVDNYKSNDVLYLDDYDRFECLMIDLFPVNRRPYAGWKNKEVKAKKVKKITT
jgi:hypothetical protein